MLDFAAADPQIYTHVYMNTHTHEIRPPPVGLYNREKEGGTCTRERRQPIYISLFRSLASRRRSRLFPDALAFSLDRDRVMLVTRAKLQRKTSID